MILSNTISYQTCGSWSLPQLNFASTTWWENMMCFWDCCKIGFCLSEFDSIYLQESTQSMSYLQDLVLEFLLSLNWVNLPWLKSPPQSQVGTLVFPSVLEMQGQESTWSTPQKTNGWNLKFSLLWRLLWKGKSCCFNIFLDSMLVFGGVSQIFQASH